MKEQGCDLGMEGGERKGRNRPESKGGASINEGERETTWGGQRGDLTPLPDAVLGPQRINAARRVCSGNLPEMRPAPPKAYSFRNCVLTSLPGDSEIAGMRWLLKGWWLGWRVQNTDCIEVQ